MGVPDKQPGHALPLTAEVQLGWVSGRFMKAVER